MIERYTRPPLRALWSDEAKYATWLDVELAACAAMERAGQVPEGVAERVRGAVTALDPARVDELESVVRHDVIAFLQHVEEQAGEDARWLHLGMTSSDVLDTSLALTLRKAADHVLEGIDRCRQALATLARRHARTPMVGRTHGIHAEPTTAGLVFALWYEELGRDRVRVERAREIISVGKLSGAVGTYSGVPPTVEADALAGLGLEPAPVANQVIQRDRHDEYLFSLAVTAASIEKIAVNIRHWQRTEVGEASEPFRKGQRGSSAMPHKKNPILCENLTGLARLVRALASTGHENVALWHERDISHSSVERLAFPDATTALDFMLHRMAGVLEGLNVHTERMMENLEMTGGLVFSQSVLLALCRAGIARSEAYARVQRNAMIGWDSGRGLLELLREDPEVVEPLGLEALESCFDLDQHLAHAVEVVDRVIPQEGA